MREIVKRETIETSIVRPCSAVPCGGLCIHGRASRHWSGPPERGPGKVATRVVLSLGQERWHRLEAQASPQGRADEMVLNDPS